MPVVEVLENRGTSSSPESNLYPWSKDKMLEITLPDHDSFLRVRETLTRIGLASKNGAKTLYQSAHILHKRDAEGNSHYFLVHFKEMFLLDGKPSRLTTGDIARRNVIADRLVKWGMIGVVDEALLEPMAGFRSIHIIPFREKKEWTLIPKYEIGKSSRKRKADTDV